MKTGLAFLLGLFVISYADVDSQQVVSLDSSDEGAPTYGGLSIDVFLDVGTADVPQITIGYAGTDKKYCLNLEKVFEVTDFEGVDPEGNTCNEDCPYNVVEAAVVSLGDAECTVNKVSDTQFTVDCANVRNATLTFTFTYVDQSETDETIGVEFTIVLNDYKFVSTDLDAKLVFEQSLSDCTEERDSNDQGEDGDNQGEDGDGDQGGDEQRRRLEDDESDSQDESAGVSSDDSKEFDLDAAVFRLTDGTAHCTDSGGDSEEVTCQLVYEASDEELLVVCDRSVIIDCGTFTLDPLCAIDLGHLRNGGYTMKGIMSIMFMAFVAVFWV